MFAFLGLRFPSAVQCHCVHTGQAWIQTIGPIASLACGFASARLCNCMKDCYPTPLDMYIYSYNIIVIGCIISFDGN